jgi:hypothetical protein
MTIFYAQNMTGEIRELVYNNIDDIPLLLKENFGDDHPLYEPIWLDEDGDEKVPPRNKEKVYVLYRYKNIPIIFVNNCGCVDENTRKKYSHYSLIITRENMENLYDEIVIDFYKEIERNIFYSEREFRYIHIDYEEYGSATKYISINEDTKFYTSIKDLFLSFKDQFNNIPDDFFNHLSLCSENYNFI